MAHAAMLETNNSYIQLFNSTDEQLQSGLLPQSVTQSGAARGLSVEQWTSRLIQLVIHKRGVAIPIPGESRAARSSVAPSTVTVPVCRSNQKRTVDLAGTRYTMCCSFCMAPTRCLSPGHPKGGQGEGSGNYCWVLMTDAAQGLGLNIMLCGDRLFHQYIVDSCAKMEEQRINYFAV